MTEAASEFPHRANVPARAMRLRPVRVLRWAATGFTILFFLPYYLAGLYILIDPPLSAFMLGQVLGGGGVEHEWRDLSRISPALVQHVIASEDAHFCWHRGVDWGALDRAADAYAEGRLTGGASTISMQTAKNLFLWSKPASLRKPFELPLALYLDFVLGKRRVMEIYLNIVEWGPGVYGAEAAARHHFGKSAASLTQQEAAQLAAALPDPVRRDAGRPSPRVFTLAEHLRARIAREYRVASCVLNKRHPRPQKDGESGKLFD